MYHPTEEWEFLREVGRRISSRRIELGISVLVLAGVTRCSRNTITNIEGGKSINLALLFRIAKALRLDISSLLPPFVMDVS